MTKRHGAQAGDPKKGVKVMYEFAVMKDPPLRVVVGTDAYAGIMDKIEKYEQNYKRWEKLSLSRATWMRASAGGRKLSAVRNIRVLCAAGWRR